MFKIINFKNSGKNGQSGGGINSSVAPGGDNGNVNGDGGNTLKAVEREWKEHGEHRNNNRYIHLYLGGN